MYFSADNFGPHHISTNLAAKSYCLGLKTLLTNFLGNPAEDEVKH